MNTLQVCHILHIKPANKLELLLPYPRYLDDADSELIKYVITHAPSACKTKCCVVFGIYVNEMTQGHRGHAVKVEERKRFTESPERGTAELWKA